MNTQALWHWLLAPCETKKCCAAWSWLAMRPPPLSCQPAQPGFDRLEHNMQNSVRANVTPHRMKYKIIFLAAMAFSNAVMAGILPLLHPDCFKGEWMVSAEKDECNIVFSTKYLPEANGYEMLINSQAENCKILTDASAWRPAPDGISLLDKEGLTIIFFAKEDEGYTSELSESSKIFLKRK